MFSPLFCLWVCFFSAAFCDSSVKSQKQSQIRIILANSVDEIDLVKAKDILIRGFMTGYEDVPLIELNSEFRSIGDVIPIVINNGIFQLRQSCRQIVDRKWYSIHAIQCHLRSAIFGAFTRLNMQLFITMGIRRFYERYFESELEHYNQEKLICVQELEGDRVLGWATFEKESWESESIYMNLLVVDPKEQARGVGRQLTFSLLSTELYPHLREIRLLICKVNQKGWEFYERIGFSSFEYNRQDNFVNLSLLTGLKWIKD